MKKPILYLAIFVLATFVFGALSCTKGSGNAKKTDAKVLFANVAVNTNSLDFYLDSTKENTTPVAYGSITSYQDVPSGAYTFKANIDSTGTNIVNTPLTLDSASDYSVFVLNYASNYSALVLNDTTATPPSGSAYIRFVDLVVGSPSFNIGTQGGPVLAGNINFEGYSGYLPVTTGSTSVQVTLASGGTVVVNFSAVTLSAGKIYTFGIAGTYGHGLTDLLMGNL